MKGNSPAYAEQIRRSWDRHVEGNIVGWLPKDVGPRQRSISLAGTIQVCERLASSERGILQKHTSKFGEKRLVVTYTLTEDEEGFRKIARTMLGIHPFLFLRSSYARHCLNNFWIPEVTRRLGRLQVKSRAIEWALKNSPTALSITLEKDFGERSQDDWLSGTFEHGEFEAWAGACLVADVMSLHRSGLFRKEGEFFEFSVRARIIGKPGVSLEGNGRIKLGQRRSLETAGEMTKEMPKDE